MSKRILVIEDDASMNKLIMSFLEKEGYETESVFDADSAVEKYASSKFHLVICDYKLGESGTAIDVLKKLKKINPKVIFIVITAFGDMDIVINCIKEGAYEYVAKPFKLDEFKKTVEDALLAQKFQNIPVEVADKEKKNAVDKEIILSKNSLMLNVFKDIAKIAPSDATVLIEGESGSGKELVARAIYRYSKRYEKPFLAVNCASIPQNLIESELFGYVKGAFTGAVSDRAGKFEKADGGTFFLDEIAEMPHELQAKLLRVLEYGEFQKLGEDTTTKVDVRIITATNKNLKKLTDKGEFRDDLYYRLNVAKICVPPLRERKDDIPVLTDYFIKKYAGDYAKDSLKLSDEVKDYLYGYHWPGNVRELENAVKKLVLFSKQNFVTMEGFKAIIELSQNSFNMEDKLIEIINSGDDIYKKAVDIIDGYVIKKVLEKTDFNQLRAAKILGMSRNTLRQKMSKLSGN